MMSNRQAITWWETEPGRFQRDQEEVKAQFRDLAWSDVGAGAWIGRLPRWPFERPEPQGLRALIGDEGLAVEIVYGQAYPMVPPSIFPTDPQPHVAEWTLHTWHVNGDGSLCLLQDAVMWDPRQSVIDLILKAAGWRIEYALMKADLIQAMTTNGIVSDASLDELISGTENTAGTAP